jgi:hypothetical protein
MATIVDLVKEIQCIIQRVIPTRVIINRKFDFIYLVPLLDEWQENKCHVTTENEHADGELV